MEENLTLLAKSYQQDPTLERLRVFYDAMHEAGFGNVADRHFLGHAGLVRHCGVKQVCDVVFSAANGDFEPLRKENDKESTVDYVKEVRKSLEERGRRGRES